MKPLVLFTLLGMLFMASSVWGAEGEFRLQARSQVADGSGQLQPQTRAATWKANETAIIVCDVWDLHHCLNAVRRLEEFAPRMNDVLKEARQRGATIIHAPSDCMPAYEQHPARQRAVAAPVAKSKPKDIEHWCSRIKAEEQAIYPLDQSDGGEDDDPAEHAEWAAKLKALGRNPGMPWKTQSKLIEIDGERDYISDRGDEVWNVLEARGIKHVILVGVHLNMCVLGRPFGLRQLAKHGQDVVLMRDMTDCMYNPQRWPHVDHFSGNDLMIAHVERYVCPTITSDQLLGGQPFRSKLDTRSVPQSVTKARLPREQWTPITLPSPWKQTAAGNDEVAGPVWYRCVVRLPKNWAEAKSLQLKIDSREPAQVWLNGQAGTAGPEFQFPAEAIVADDYNLLVVRVEHAAGAIGLKEPPVLISGSQQLKLQGRWQFRLGDDKSWSNIPLPAKFGGATDMTFEVQ